MPLRLVLAALVACWAALLASAAPAASRPNIVWIIADDLSPDLGCYGDTYARTPQLDRLAAQGRRFDQAFAVSGVCAPARSALITGMYPTQIGSLHMRSAAVPPPHVRCFTEALRAAGYYCSNQGKTDFNFSTLIQRRIQDGVDDPPLGAFDVCGPGADWNGRGEDQPFFAIFNLFTTHESQIRLSPDAFATLVDAGGGIERHDPEAAAIPPYYPDDPLVRECIARYHDLTTRMDQQVGEILARLDAVELTENTYVFFFSDHGRGLPRAKRWLYDAGLQVPLLVRGPGIEAGSVDEGLVSFVDFAPTVLALAGVGIPDHLVGTSFLDGAQERPPHVFAARDRLGPTRDRIRSARSARYKYIRNFHPELPYTQPIPSRDKMPLMQAWRRLASQGALHPAAAAFFADNKPAEEFYDLLADPHEVHNRAGDESMQEELEHHRTALRQWLASTGDLGEMDEEQLRKQWRPDGQVATTATPIAEPASGPFDGPVTVELSSATAGASIVYTSESGEDAQWYLYTEPLRLVQTTQLRCQAGRLGMDSSEVQEFRYTISAGKEP